ncbi:MAG: NGG1p interacting factor NIF3 [Bacteriovoracaceae bacterium]|nr:NGG1p interacting factor NIF3 [Bacteriovoracaceae bacterium]
MYKFIFYAPENACEKIKKSVFETGAGTIGKYEQCAFEISGIGQFKPALGAAPAIGEVGTLEKVQERRVEILCTEKNIRPALKAMLESHPYEEPAYEIIAVENHRFI